MAKSPNKPIGKGADQRRRYSISTVLMAGFGVLIVLGVVGVFSITMWSARENTFDLLADKVELTNAALVNQLRQRLEPVRRGSGHIVEQVASGEFDPANQLELADRFTSAMAIAPQVLGMAFISTDIDVIRVRRGRGGLTVHVANEGDRKDLRLAMDDASRRAQPYWGRLVWSADVKSAMIDLRSPLRRKGKFLGMLVSVVSVGNFLGPTPGLGEGGATLNRFVLYGKGHVLAHDGIAPVQFERSARRPLPGIDQVGDPVLARLWDTDSHHNLGLKLTGQSRGHVIEFDGDYYPVFYRTLSGYGSAKVIVGAYVQPGSSEGVEMRRLGQAGIAAGVVLLLVVILAWVLGRKISGPVRELAAAARRIGELDFSQDIHFKNTRLREFEDAAGAFNSMMAGLKWFETYVPRALARRIIKAGGDARIESAEHEVTVMFTDIARFSGLAESLSAAETADLLNGHFSILGGCIETEGGTLDKFIGDSVMAFWAPPINPDDQMARACRAALAIRDAVARDNQARIGRDADPIRVRIGIHSGPAIVGNIGAPGRINYTVVGDTVNLAQRLEELGKTAWGSGNDAIILVSGDVADGLGDDFQLTARGNQEIRGRDGGLRVFRLDSGTFEGSESILELTSEVESEPPAENLKRSDSAKTADKKEQPEAPKAYNPAVHFPAAHEAISASPLPKPDAPKPGSLRLKTASSTPPPTSKPASTPITPVAKPDPIDNGDTPCPPVEPQVAPPGSPTANRYGVKDPKGYDFDWDLESLDPGDPGKSDDDDIPDK
jgi:adenylate cyclase